MCVVLFGDHVSHVPLALIAVPSIFSPFLTLADTNTVLPFLGYLFALLTVPLAIWELLSFMYSIGLFLPLMFLLWGLYPQFHVLELIRAFGSSVRPAATDAS